MSLARTRRHELINNELTKEDFHDIETVSDLELESYALSSIVIERLWPFQKMFLMRYELPLIPKDEQFLGRPAPSLSRRLRGFCQRT
ncbi:MAG: hypothetical protein U0487_01650 [Patescibacteria group bacterium]